MRPDVSTNLWIAYRRLSAKLQSPLLLRSWTNPDNIVHVANMGPTWVLSAPAGPHVGPMNLAIREAIDMCWNLAVPLVPLWASSPHEVLDSTIFKSSQIKSNQVYCYTNNTNYTTPYNEYNVALHLKYIFQLHLTQLKFSIAKGAGNPVGLKGSRSVNTVLAHKKNNKMAYNGCQVTQWCQRILV